MRRLLLPLFAASVLSSMAQAEEYPAAGKRDPRMRHIAYSDSQVVHLSTAVGATLVVGFSPKETVTAVAVTDSKDLKAMPKGSFLFFKSQIALPVQPVIVLTSGEAGMTRRYVFEITTFDSASLAAKTPGVYYSVQFTYPDDDAAARRALAAAQQAKDDAQAQARETQFRLRLAHAQMEQRARDPFSGSRNWHYIAQGDRTLLPLEVFDNGFSTVFRFPGNVRIPSVFAIDPDGREATPNYAVKGDLVQVDSIARGWRLRDGQTVLCIWNRAFDPVGRNPGTGTTSPDVQTRGQGGRALSDTGYNAATGVDSTRSVVSGGAPSRQLTAVQKVGVAGLVLVVSLAFIWLQQLGRATREVKQPDVSLAGGGAFIPAPSQAPQPVPSPAPALPMPAPSASLLGPQQHEITPVESPILAFTGSGGGPVEATAVAPVAPPMPAPGGADVPADNALSSRLKPTQINASKARLLPHPDMMVTKGTIISCTLQTAINTQLAGFVKCVLPQSVRSTTGNVVLLDRGTIVVGEIQGGLMRGQDRVFVLWDRAETPDHAIIELSSPGTDELGRSGLPGQVDNHFWDRFGGAILLSVINGGLQAGTALAANAGHSGSGGAFVESFQSNGSNVADTALQATINIPPTLEKNQGDNIAIFVAKDLDFSDVYNLHVTDAARDQ